MNINNSVDDIIVLKRLYLEIEKGDINLIYLIVCCVKVSLISRIPEF